VSRLSIQLCIHGADGVPHWQLERNIDDWDQPSVIANVLIDILRLWNDICRRESADDLSVLAMMASSEWLREKNFGPQRRQLVAVMQTAAENLAHSDYARITTQAREHNASMTAEAVKQWLSSGPKSLSHREKNVAMNLGVNLDSFREAMAIYAEKFKASSGGYYWRLKGNDTQ
jgi:hypothetical protein